MADWYVSSAAWTAIAQFAASGAYTVGQIVRPLTAPALNARHAFRCTTAGTASTEPTWPGTYLSTVTTGGATFTNVSGASAYGWSAAAGSLYCLGSGGGTGYRANPGDRFFLSSDHSESSAGGLVYLLYGSSVGGVIEVISVNRAGNVPPQVSDYTAGAALTTTGANNALISDAGTTMYWQGITFSCGGNFLSNSAGVKTTYLKNCAIVLTGNGSVGQGNPGGLVLDNTTISFSSASMGVFGGNYKWAFTWINTPSAILGAAVPTLLIQPGQNALYTLRGVDLSALTTTLVQGNLGARVLFDSCRIAPGVARCQTPGASWCNVDEVELVNCFDGTNIINERHTFAGDLTINRSVTLVGGAQDDVGLFSLLMISNLNSDFLVATLDSFWMDVENTYVGSTRTATVEIICAVGSLNNSDIALALEYQGTSGSSLATLTSSLPNPLATSAALPTSTAAWNNAPSPAANTFDPTFNTAAFTLSGGNMTAALVGSGHQNVRTIYGFGSGKVYFEATALVLGSAGCGPGIGNLLAGTGFLGGVVGGFQYISSGAVYTNNGVIATIATYVVNNVICVAVDIGNKKIWFRVNGGNWNNTAGNDPGSNVGGYDLTALLANNGTVYAAFDGWQAGDSFRFNMGATAFAQTVPTGFSGLPTGAPPTLQHLQVTFTPQQAGRVRGVVRLGRPSTTIYVNPQIIVT